MLFDKITGLGYVICPKQSTWPYLISNAWVPYFLFFYTYSLTSYFSMPNMKSYIKMQSSGKKPQCYETCTISASSIFSIEPSGIIQSKAIEASMLIFFTRCCLYLKKKKYIFDMFLLLIFVSDIFYHDTSNLIVISWISSNLKTNSWFEVSLLA